MGTSLGAPTDPSQYQSHHHHTRMRSLIILLIAIFLANIIYGNHTQGNKEDYYQSNRFWFRLKKREAPEHKEDIENVVEKSSSSEAEAEVVENSGPLNATQVRKNNITQRRLKRGPSCRRLLLKNEFLEMSNIPAIQGGPCS